MWSIFQLDVSIDRLLATMNLVVTMGKSPSLPTLGTNLSHNMKQNIGEGGRLWFPAGFQIARFTKPSMQSTSNKKSVDGKCEASICRLFEIEDLS